jgi:predicted ribosome quality control (RQC) complex YloA/Tae2 family protein
MDIEKMSNIDISQDSVKSISEKCNQLKDLHKQIEEQEDKLKTLKNKSRDLEERVIPSSLS